MSVIHFPEQQQFIYVTENNEKAGRLAYRIINESKIDAYTTKVEEAFQGKGIAAALYNALIEFAQQQQLKIKPSCHYIEKKMERSHPELIA